MPNNFRLTGNYYVSKEGSDSNDGLTAETPLLTIQAALNKITTASVTRSIIVGSGVYRENLSRTLPQSTTTNIIADGYCVLESNINGSISIAVPSSGSSISLNLIGFELRNYNNITFSSQAACNWNINFQNCIIKNCNIVNNAFVVNNNSLNVTYTRCIIINTKGLNQPVSNIFGSILNQVLYSYFESCILINSSFLAVRLNLPITPLSVIIGGMVDGMKNTYVDDKSIFTIHALVSLNNELAGGVNGVVNPNLFINNNIQGKIICEWTGAVSGVNSVGVPLTLAQHRIDYPTFNVNSFSSDPLFNDPQNLNFTLQSTSPHIKAGNDGSNIGGTEYAVYRAASSTEFTTGATISGLTLRGNNSYTITSSPTPGTIQTAPIFLQWPAVKPLTKLEWAGSLEFDKSITAGTFGNNNVPDWDTYTTGAGASPDRITVQMRFSTQQTQPTLSSHWDNGGYWTAGNYELFEVNSKPKVDSNGKGNGNPDYIESSALGDLVPTWIQLNIKLIDTYNP